MAELEKSPDGEGFVASETGRSNENNWQNQPLPPEVAQEDEKRRREQQEKYDDSVSVQLVLEDFKGPNKEQTNEEFEAKFNEVRNQLKPYFEKYGVPEPDCFGDVEEGDYLPGIYYDVMLAGYGLLREKIMRGR